MAIPAAFGIEVHSAVSAENVAVDPHVVVILPGPNCATFGAAPERVGTVVVGSYPPVVYPLPDVWVTFEKSISVDLAMPFPEFFVPESIHVVPAVAAPCVCAGHAGCETVTGLNAFSMQLSNTALLYVPVIYSLVSFFALSSFFVTLFTIVTIGADAPVLPPSTDS